MGEVFVCTTLKSVEKRSLADGKVLAAAKDLTDTPRQFELNVRRSMQGGHVAGQSFSNVMRR